MLLRIDSLVQPRPAWLCGLLVFVSAACSSSSSPEGGAGAPGSGAPGAGTAGQLQVTAGSGGTGGTATPTPTAGNNAGGSQPSAGTGAGGVAGAGGGSAGAPQGGSEGGASPSAGSAGESLGSAGASAGSGGAGPAHWVGTWATSEQLTETQNNPPSPGLTNNTLRQVVRASIGGQRLRVRFSNKYGNAPVTLQAAHIAKSTGAGAIDTASDKALSFGGMASATIAAGETVTSDAFDFALDPNKDVALTIHFGATASNVTGHPGSRTTSYLQTGEAVSTADLSSATKTDHWYIIEAIDVEADASSGAIAILGDSITDGRGSTTNMQNRWPDQLSARLRGNAATAKVAVLNFGVGGNQVLSGGLGVPAVQRFEHEILNSPGVRWFILYEGVNDIGTGNAQTGTALIRAFEDFVEKARAKQIKAYCATITPLGTMYYSADHEQARQTVNTWVRTQGNCDATLDFDAAVRDANDASKLASAYLFENDGLHMNPSGLQKLADSIDLTLFQ